jgi:hypothetical protein
VVGAYAAAMKTYPIRLTRRLLLGVPAVVAAAAVTVGIRPAKAKAAAAAPECAADLLGGQ